jgi:hypothetical protein
MSAALSGSPTTFSRKRTAFACAVATWSRVLRFTFGLTAFYDLAVSID